MKLKKRFFVLVSTIAIIIILLYTFVSNKNHPTRSLQASIWSFPLPYTYIPLHCEASKISETLKVIKQISSWSIIELNTQDDCKTGYFILEVPVSIREAIAQGNYKMVILGDDSNQGPRTSFTANEWQWLKNLNTQLIINREVEITFPGVSRTVDQRDLFEILPILTMGIPKKYTNMVEYSKQFPESLTQENIKKCDSLVPGSISYSWAQTLYKSPKKDNYPAEMKWFKDRADCYTKVIR